MPQIPTEVTAVAEESGKVTLSWTLPEAGINGGWVNLTKVSYDILRNGESLSQFSNIIGIIKVLTLAEKHGI